MCQADKLKKIMADPSIIDQIGKGPNYSKVEKKNKTIKIEDTQMGGLMKVVNSSIQLAQDILDEIER